MTTRARIPVETCVLHSLLLVRSGVAFNDLLLSTRKHIGVNGIGQCHLIHYPGVNRKLKTYGNPLDEHWYSGYTTKKRAYHTAIRINRNTVEAAS